MWNSSRGQRSDWKVKGRAAVVTKTSRGGLSSFAPGEHMNFRSLAKSLQRSVVHLCQSVAQLTDVNCLLRG
jgi:hypothetical protein